MNVAPVLGKSYKLHVINKLEEFDELSPILSELVGGYLSKSPDKYSREEILNAMQLGTGRVFVCMAEKNGLGLSLLTAHPVDDDGKSAAMVNIGYMGYEHATDDEARDIKRESLKALEDWAKKNKMVSLLMQNNQKESVFDRFLRPDGWKRIMTIYEKELIYEKQANPA